MGLFDSFNEEDKLKAEELERTIKSMIQSYCNKLGCKDCPYENHGCVSEVENQLRDIEVKYIN